MEIDITGVLSGGLLNLIARYPPRLGVAPGLRSGPGNAFGLAESAGGYHHAHVINIVSFWLR